MARHMRRLEAVAYAGSYRPEFVTYVRKLALLGLSRAEIARNLGADRNTFMGWCERFPEFRRALDEGLLIADFNVTEALLKRALGYRARHKKIVAGVVVEESDVDIPPDTGAIQTWLYNRHPDLWRPVNRIEGQAPNSDALNARRFVHVPSKGPEPGDDDVTDVQARDVTPQPGPAA